MGCACVKHLSNEPESILCSVETIQAKETSQIIPEIADCKELNGLSGLSKMSDCGEANEFDSNEFCEGEAGSVYTVINTSDRPELIRFEISTRSFEKINIGQEIFWDSGMVEVTFESFHFLFFAGGLDPGLNKEVSNTFAIHLPISKPSESPYVEKLENLTTVKRRSRLLFDAGCIYSIGGVREVKTRLDNRLVIRQCYSNNFERFQFECKKWEVLEDLPVGAELPACEVINGKIFVFGGAVIEGGFFDGNKKVQVYTIDLHSWTILAVSLEGPVYGGLAVRFEDTVIIFGGINPDDESLKDVWSFDGSLNKIGIVSGENFSLFFPYCCWKFGKAIYGFNDDEQLLRLDLQNFSISSIN